MLQPIITTISLAERQVDVLRLELMHPQLQGNKYYKLKYNLEHIQEQGYEAILTFGGVFSNHIHAVACACAEKGLRCVAVLRGEDDPNNPTLSFIRNKGVEVLFITRVMYRMRNMPEFIDALSTQYGKIFVLPEGGTNPLAVQGCSEILTGLEHTYDQIFCAVGTGGTLAGIISTPGLQAKVTGISALKYETDALTPAVQKMLPGHADHVQWHILPDIRFGGYAKYHPQLARYLDSFQHRTGMQADPVYTGKMFFTAEQMIADGKCAAADRILCIHTGGLQGWNGWMYRYAKKYTTENSA